MLPLRRVMARQDLRPPQRRIAPKVLLPGRRLKERTKDTLCQKSGYRGWNGQKHESNDTESGFGEVASALSDCGHGAQTKADRSSRAVARLSPQVGDSVFRRQDGESGVGEGDGSSGEL